MSHPAPPPSAPPSGTPESGLTLDAVPTGASVRVRAVQGEGALVRRLAELGVRAGQAVRALHRTAGGGRLVAVGDTRVALSRPVLRTVLVETGGPSGDQGARDEP